MMNTSNITTSKLLTILDIMLRLAEQRMVQPLAEYVATTLFELTSAERCLIVLFDDDGSLQIATARTRGGAVILDATDQVSRSILQQVRDSQTPVLVDDALSDSLLAGAGSVLSLGLRSVMCVPLVSQGQAVGAIYVENRSARGRFCEDDLVPLVLFANQVVVALANARLYEALEAAVAERTRELQEANALLAHQAEELREQSIRDSLTGLYNRRYFTELLPALFEQTRQGQGALALACADIDHFKQINDTFLHSCGDQVLITVARLLREQIYPTDYVARIGGEEFAVLIGAPTFAAAAELCEHLRRSVEEFDWDAVAPGLRVTVSLGVVAAEACASAEELLLQADSRLYQAKRAGKNRVAAGDGL